MYMYIVFCLKIVLEAEYFVKKDALKPIAPQGLGR